MVQVAEVVAEELYARYEHQLLETQLESMADVVTCPRWGTVVVVVMVAM